VGNRKSESEAPVSSNSNPLKQVETGNHE
jgi:hypothetical protein